jgi:hypothetical protein
MANYPTSVPSFSAKSAGQTIQHGHVNDLQDEVVAIGSGLLQGTAPLNSSNSTVVSLTVSSLASAPAQPRCFAYSTSVQSLSSGSTTVLTLGTERFDIGGLFAANTLTVPAGSSGIYWCAATAFVATLSTLVHLHIRRNSTNFVSEAAFTPTNNGLSVSAQGIVSLNATDTLDVTVTSFASTLSVGTAAPGFESRFQAIKLW